MEKCLADEIQQISIEWINDMMKRNNLKRKDIVAETGIDKSYLSLLFAKPENPRKIKLSRPMKAMFYYYFLSKN